MQGHAGTVPMDLRRDPVAAAAEAVVALERRCGGGHYPDTVLDGEHPAPPCTSDEHNMSLPSSI